MLPDDNSDWMADNSALAMAILERAYELGRPVVLLTGAGISVDSGFPLASELKEYLVHVNQLVLDEDFSNVRQYIEEARWPSRHDLRLELTYKACNPDAKDSRAPCWLRDRMQDAERRATQTAMTSELRHSAPTLASSLQEIFNQLNSDVYNQEELAKKFASMKNLAEHLGMRSPNNIAYRSLLFSLCDDSQTTIDACFDHFMRDRHFTTTHQFVYFLTQLLRSKIIFTTNFDPLMEHAFLSEGMVPKVYEVQGEGTIPSAKLLLSQPLSIVKLHGGAHQMNAGFDLDDPMSPTALASFAELYHELERLSNGRKPLTVVMGYSGSDRRVMDIIADQIYDWDPVYETDERDVRVLWISRPPWIPPPA